MARSGCDDWREQLASLCEEMGVDQHAACDNCDDWREQLASLCQEMGVDQHAACDNCDNWREQLASLHSEIAPGGMLAAMTSGQLYPVPEDQHRGSTRAATTGTPRHSVGTCGSRELV